MDTLDKPCSSSVSSHSSLLAGRSLKQVVVLFLLFMFLLLQYLFNFDADNLIFSGFQSDSESLVVGPIIMVYNRETDDRLALGNRTAVAISESAYLHYATSQTTPPKNELLLDENLYFDKYVKAGGYFCFPDGTIMQITEIERDDALECFRVVFNGDVSEYANAYILSLSTTMDLEGNPNPSFAFAPYESQYGLQGRLFVAGARLLCNFVDIDSYVSLLHWLTAALMSFTATIIFYFIYFKLPDKLLGIVVYLVFLTSPWVVSFARNLYWVEFTWFLPVLVGLVYACSPPPPSAPKKLGAAQSFFYAFSFFTVLVKCLCGYEYISTVLVTLVFFPLCKIISSPELRRNKRVWVDVILMGVCGVIGFIVAAVMHSFSVGNGDFFAGFNHVLTVASYRTLGFYSNVPIALPPYINSLGSVLEVYFRFNTQIVTGVDSNLFFLMIFASLMSLLTCYSGRQRLFFSAFFVLSAFATFTWFVLAMGHSACHPHMNYVLWYFGFIQAIIYIPLRALVNIIKRICRVKSRE